MLRDIQESSGVNNQILIKQGITILEPPVERHRAFDDEPRLAPSLQSPNTYENRPELSAKILSRLFWPSLNDERFKVPPPITELQRRYEQGFEELKSARKLTWLPALGQATVELVLEDRTICEQVHTWQAAVIYAFDGLPDGLPVSKTASQLEEELEMDEDLIQSALTFWTNQLVLHESSPGTYAVLETLNNADRERSNAQNLLAVNHVSNIGGSEDSNIGGRKGNGKGGIEKDSDKMGIYWSFVQGMLTNSSKEMQVAQIGMMLKMLIVEGFPFSHEELAEWLGGKVQEGMLEVNGGKYRLKR